MEIEMEEMKGYEGMWRNIDLKKLNEDFEDKVIMI